MKSLCLIECSDLHGRKSLNALLTNIGKATRILLQSFHKISISAETNLANFQQIRCEARPVGKISSTVWHTEEDERAHTSQERFCGDFGVSGTLCGCKTMLRDMSRECRLIHCSRNMSQDSDSVSNWRKRTPKCTYHRLRTAHGQ